MSSTNTAHNANFASVCRTPATYAAGREPGGCRPDDGRRPGPPTPLSLL